MAATKYGLAQKFAKLNEISESKAYEIVGAVITSMSETLAEEGELSLPGIGKVKQKTGPLLIFGL